MIFKRSMVSELANAAGAVFTVLFTIVLAVGMVRILSLAAGGRIDNSMILQMILYTVLTNLPTLLTLSLFVAVMITMLRWWQDNEVVVWFSSGGRSLFSWIAPVFRFAIPTVLAIGLLSVVISPWARSQIEITRAQFMQRDEVNHLSPGRFIETMGGKRVFFIESMGEDANEVGRIFVAETTSKGESLVTSDGGRVEVNDEGDRYIVLHDGRRYETKDESSETRLLEFDQYGLRLDIKVDKALEAHKTVSLPMSALYSEMTPDQEGEIFWRLCWPLAAFNLAFIAIPLSATSPRAGRSLNLISAVLLFVLYLNGISIVQTWIEHQKVGYIVGLIGLNGSVFLLGVLLFIRRVYMLRWLPAWMNPWTFYHAVLAKRDSSKGGH